MATNTPIQYTPYETQGHELKLTAERIEALLIALDISDIAETITKKTLEDLNAIINTIKDWDDSDDDLSVKEQLINIYTKMLSEEETDNVIDKTDINNTNDKHVPTVKAVINALAEMEHIVEDGLNALETSDINIASTTSARELAARIRNAEGKWQLCIEDKIDSIDKTISDSSNLVDATTKGLTEHESKHPFKRDKNGGIVQTAPDGTTDNVAAKGSVATGEGCCAWAGNSKVGGKDTHTTTHPKLTEPPNPTFADVFGEGLRAYFPHMFMRGKYNRRDVTEPLAEVIGAGDDVNNQKDIRQLDWLGNLWNMGHILTGGNGLDDENAFDNTQAILDNIAAIAKNTQSIKNNELHFGWTQLSPEEEVWTQQRFELRPNMLFVIAPGGLDLRVHNSNNSDVTSSTNVGLCIGLTTDLKQFDGAEGIGDSTKDSKFGCMFIWQKSTSALSSPFSALRFVLSDKEGERCYIENVNTSASAGVAYIKKGS